MPKFKDRTGHRHGRLLVKECVGKDHRGKYLWLCSCDCGTDKIVVSDNLSSGKSNSCGCLREEVIRRPGNQYGIFKDRRIAILRVQYSHLKRRNTKMGFDEVIDFDTFTRLVESSCDYCGLEYSKEIEDRSSESKKLKLTSDYVLKCNGIDRLDSNLGYSKDNTVPCCKYCNIAKNVMSKDEFLGWVKRVYEHLYW